MSDFINFMAKINKTSKQIVDSVSTSVLVKNDYEETLNMVNGMVLGLIMDIVTEGAKEKK